MFVLQTGVGVKIPWPGYLDPPPTYLFLKAQQIPYDIKKNCCSISCHSCNRINSTGLNKKKNVSHISLGIRDGGQDTPAGVS